MKLRFTYIPAALLGLAFAASCSDIEDLQPLSGTMLASQVQETNAAISSRADASFNAIYTFPGQPDGLGYETPHDYGFISLGFQNDIEGADLILPNSGYNWYSSCSSLYSRNLNYYSAYIFYSVPYQEIAKCNDVLNAFDANTDDTEIIAKIAQAKALRAWSYMTLAPLYQFRYATSADLPCVPIVTEETTNYTNNPRATVAEVYEFILSDLDYAIEHLEGFVRSDKAKVDQMVAYGLRARAYLAMEKWAEAAADAATAESLATAAGLAPVKPTGPSFMDLSETNWMWGYDMTDALAQVDLYATSSSWIRSFSAEAYSAAVQVYSCINKMLYDMIPSTDVRKGWWVDENLESPLIEGLTWKGYPVATAEITNEKMAFLPYTNVKFGCNTIGTSVNDEDWPWMRVEEMILVQVEALYKSGDKANAISKLESFIKTYRDPDYSFANSQCATEEDEIWFQRRVELWGEGFASPDTRRLGKNLVRFHDSTAASSNVPEDYMLNMAADDPWWLLRFPQTETDTNLAVENNTGGSVPQPGQNGNLLDGVTNNQ